MGASKEKKIRAQARAEGNDVKAIKAAEAKIKAKKTKAKYALSIIAMVIVVAAVLFANSDYLYKNTTALTVGEKNFTPADVNYAYATQYYTLANQYGSYATLLGLDTSYGLAGLKNQNTSYGTNENQTWRDYFIEAATTNLTQLVALNDYAKENGLELTEEEIAEIDAEYATVEETAAGYGYKTAAKFYNANYGKGVDTQVAYNYELLAQTASKVYMTLLDEAAENDTEFVDYNTKNSRHILIKAVAEEDGTYTEEALQAAKDKINEILAEYKAGEMTEENFATLAETYSEDAGSNTNGGLYENTVKGSFVEEYNNFIYANGRKAGDVAVVYGESTTYKGYHLVYFVGNGVPYSETSERSSELTAVVDPQIEEIASSYEAIVGKTMNLVGKN